VKKDYGLNASFVNRGDMMQMPMNRKMLNEVGVEHQERQKTNIENECVSTRSKSLIPRVHAVQVSFNYQVSYPAKEGA
jgi:hypothetical protein